MRSLLGSSRFWLGCAASSALLAACGSSDGARKAQDSEGGAGGEQAAAGAPSVSGTGGTPPLPQGGAGGDTEMVADGGVPTHGGAPVDGGAGPGPDPVMAVVEAKYPSNGSFWLDYVKNDGTDVTSASDTACAPATDGPRYDACVHGGEVRRLALPGEADCTGVSATDALGAFDWKCQAASPGIELVSTGLHAGKHMSDLIDFPNNAWKPNALSVTRDGAALAESEPAAWWTNPVERLAGASCTVDRGAEHTIFLVDGASSNADCTAATGKIGLASVPGETVTDFRFHRRGSFSWYEGEYTMQTQFTVFAPNEAGGFHVVRNASFTATVTPGTGNATALSMGAARASVVRDITASGGRDIVGAGSATGLQISNLTSTGAALSAISLNSCTDCSIVGSTLSSTGSRAISVSGVNPRLLIRDIVANDNVGGAIVLSQVTNGRVENVKIARAGNNGGVSTTLTASTIFKSIFVDGAVGVGVSVNQGNDNRLVDIHVGNAGANGVLLSSERNVLQHARISCGKGVSITTGTGVQITSPFNRVQDVTTASCRYGIDLSSDAHVIQGITVAATEDVGVRFGGWAHVLEDAVAIDTSYGMYFLSQTGVTPRVRNFASSHNATASVYSNNSTIDIAGQLIVGNNGPTATGADCVVTSTTGLNAACGGSTATLTTGASVLASIVGLVSDPLNAQGATGSSPQGSITSFLTFGAETRRFIKAGGGFPDYSARGPCLAADTCSILDLALKSTDTLLKNRNALPTGNDVVTQNWLINNNAPADQAACTARVPGSVFVAAAPNRCESTFLAHAWELLEDGIGDNDGMCESNETCEVARNIGGYQGHGPLVSAGAFTPGTLTGITLVQRETNGY